MAYNPYNDANAIYNFKDIWHTADAKGDKKTADEAEKKAKEYYAQLRDNGYGDLADALSNTNNTGAKAIVDYLSKNSAPTVKTTTSTPITGATPTSIQGKIDTTFGKQINDSNVMAGKYDTLEDYIYNHNPYEDEIGKSIMESYKFKGKTASDNAVASGAGSNGGNIDSYAAANANRQQLAFTNAGNQAILNDFNTRMQNVRDSLNALGIYQQNQDKGMQTTINLQQTEEQRVFDNEQTAKNNDVVRKQTIADVTGYAPDEWVNANNMFLDENGRLKPEYANLDFKAIMETSKDENIRKQASVARAVKIFSDYEKYGQYDDGDYTANGDQITESRRQFDTTADLTEKEINAGLEKTKTQAEADKYVSNNSLAGNKYASDKALEGDKYKADKEAEKNKLTLSQAINLIKSGIPSEEAIKVFNEYAKTNYTLDNPPNFDDKESEAGKFFDELLGGEEEATTEAGTTDSGETVVEQWDKTLSTYDITKKKTKNFLKDHIYNMWLNEIPYTSESIKEIILENSEKYDIDVEDARKILNMLGADASWLSDYDNRSWFNFTKGMKKTT